MALDVAGKTVVITGASAGIGRELALLMARKGARLALLARRKPLLEELAQECGAGSQAMAVQCDVTQRPSCQAAIQTVVSEFKEIDILILNAGMSMGCYFEDIKDLADGDFMLSLNVMGVANVLHYAFPFIPKVRGSRIVVISSIAGAIGVPFRTLYCASKWAVNGFCASLRTELEEAYGENAPKVVVSCPPEVATGLNTNRLKFGNEATAQFDEKTAASPTLAAQLILDAICEGVRIGFFSKMHAWLHSLYACCPSRIDKMIIDGVKKSHRAPRYGNM
ncbi:11-beta-hydroxysteroid dehydrogenase-like 2 (17-beta-hydroxysteroid dehydrogenase-like 2) (Hydroxysteroid dehydrogenase 2) (AtHSD2) [Durusdinium trenchii]|uniref:11-beta-hydroxysteroid dehydrogenase-like 2 (17-beta-hydroxysteroid dehydrogenase-like 2) (Hydroxysteroid dehydrogenase 2) (AtHSD2) n=2 Tax=Durusdinium trenchii TaxID=1381693 RepID=A0ABP0HAR5_9DINO|eukprot:g8125.t1